MRADPDPNPDRFRAEPRRAEVGAPQTCAHSFRGGRVPDADSDDDFASAAGDDDFDLDPRELVSDPGFQSAVEGLRSLVPREQTESPATVNTQRGDRP